MSLSRFKKNKTTLAIATTILVCFFALLFVYKNEISLNYQVSSGGNPAQHIPSVTATSSEIITPTTSTSTSGTPSVSGTVSTPIQVGREIGIAAGSKLIGLSDSDLNKDLSEMAGMGITWVRFDIEWGFVQANQSKYDWSRYDRIINTLNKYNLKALPILTYSPEWARVPGCRGGAHCPPADPKTFATFASAAATRYKSKGVHYWEIWNEPNSYDFWATKSDCVAYTNLLKATYPALKKADSASFVITGGLAQLSTTDVNISALEFLQCIYDNDGKNYFDAVGDHPYTFPALPSDSQSNAWAKMSKTSPSFRGIMVANGDSNKKIWMTEYGAPTGGPDSHWYITEDKQAKMVEDTLSLYKSYSWAGPIFFYTYIDSGFDSSTNEIFFGFVRFDGTPKPAYFTLKKIISEGL